MNAPHALSGFAVYVTAPERLDMHGGTEDTANAIMEGLTEGRPIMMSMTDVRVITAGGAQLLFSLYKHHAEDVMFDDVPDDVIEALRFIGADPTIITWIQEQA